jgi:glucosyl-dolichyl phosphate glucuronosyltransferase
LLLRPQITVAICTLNRAAYLSRALESLLVQSSTEQSFDIVIIDNGSTDDTATVIENARQRRPGIRCVVEHRLGLSHARNRALTETTTALIAFLDDDAVASPQWVGSLIEAFTRIVPTPGCVGGKVRPLWEAPRPAWLADQLLQPLTIVDWCPTPRPLRLPGEYLAGANIAFRTDLLRAVGGFDAGLGRVGTRLLSGEDLLAQILIAQKGFVIHYEPSACVDHHVHMARLSKPWFLQRFLEQGMSDAILQSRLLQPSLRDKTRAFFSAVIGLLARPKSWTNRRFDCESADQFATRCEGRHRLGMLIAMLSSQG